jgi:hypothetical protein
VLLKVQSCATNKSNATTIKERNQKLSKLKASSWRGNTTAPAVDKQLVALTALQAVAGCPHAVYLLGALQWAPVSPLLHYDLKHQLQVFGLCWPLAPCRPKSPFGLHPGRLSKPIETSIPPSQTNFANTEGQSVGTTLPAVKLEIALIINRDKPQVTGLRTSYSVAPSVNEKLLQWMTNC